MKLVVLMVFILALVGCTTSFSQEEIDTLSRGWEQREDQLIENYLSTINIHLETIETLRVGLLVKAGTVDSQKKTNENLSKERDSLQQQIYDERVKGNDLALMLDKEIHQLRIEIKEREQSRVKAYNSFYSLIAERDSLLKELDK